MPEFFKLFSIFLMAMVKYFYSPFYAFATGESFWISYITIALGGIASFSFFYYISTFIVISTRFIKPVMDRIIPEKTAANYREKRELKKSRRKKFTKRNRLMMKMKKSGMWLIILTTPVLLSLPVGAFLLNKYFSHNKLAYIGALLAIVVEGFIICLFLWHINPFV
jgi:hypothetical protein